MPVPRCVYYITLRPPVWPQTKTDEKLGGNKFDARQAREHDLTPLYHECAYYVPDQQQQQLFLWSPLEHPRVAVDHQQLLSIYYLLCIWMSHSMHMDMHMHMNMSMHVNMHTSLP